MSELAVALLLAALIAPPSAPAANGTPPPAGARSAVASSHTASAPYTESAAREPQRKGQQSDGVKPDSKSPAPAPVTAARK